MNKKKKVFLVLNERKPYFTQSCIWCLNRKSERNVHHLVVQRITTFEYLLTFLTIQRNQREKLLQVIKEINMYNKNDQFSSSTAAATTITATTTTNYKLCHKGQLFSVSHDFKQQHPAIVQTSSSPFLSFVLYPITSDGSHSEIVWTIIKYETWPTNTCLGEQP